MSLKLIVATTTVSIPYSCLVSAYIINSLNKSTIDINYEDVKLSNGVQLITESGEVLNSQGDILSFLNEKYFDTPGVEKWIDVALNELTNRKFNQLTTHLESIDTYLTFRSYFIGYSTSIADIAIYGAIKANPVLNSVIQSNAYLNVSRWYNFLNSSLNSFITEIDQKKSGSKTKSKKKETHQANFKIDLPNAEMGRVVTRFPPEPSGYLHIGHVKAAILNEYFARAYNGTLIIRFDDTNPTKEKVEFQNSIIEDLKLLGINGDKMTYSSDYFDQMYELAIQMIKDGNAYCDDTPLERMRQERMDGIASSRRDRSVEENLKIFTHDMKEGTETGLKSCLRAKIDYQALNKALRDPVLYRTNLTPHHRTGSCWKMYPTYDFCEPVVDSIEGVTHSLRTNEYRDRNPQYQWIIQALKLRHVDIWDFGRINFVRTLLSKRKLQWFVDKGYVSNWDDPRFPTIRGVVRRGMTVEGLRNFIMSQGPSKNIINLEWSVLWALNKKVIDPIAPRFTAIDDENMVVVHLNCSSESRTENKPKHKKNPTLGEKKVIYYNQVLIEQADAKTFDINEEITLMDWGNIIIRKIDKTGDLITNIDAELHLDGDFKKTSKKVTWLADTPDKVKVELVDFDHLITKDKLEEGENFEDYITPESEFHSFAYADLNLRDAKAGDIIQFERKGYFRIDKPLGEDEKVTLFTIPDGKAVSRYGVKS